MSYKDDYRMLRFIYDRLANVYHVNEETDYMRAFRAYVDQHRAGFHDRFVLVTEHDIRSERWMESQGPIAMETNLGESTADKVLERAKSVGNGYGRIMVCKLVPMGSPDEFKTFIDRGGDDGRF